MRFCKTFHCDTMGDRVCCCTCPWVRDCSYPCLNHPSRCGLEDKDRPETARPRRKRRDRGGSETPGPGEEETRADEGIGPYGEE